MLISVLGLINPGQMFDIDPDLSEVQRLKKVNLFERSIASLDPMIKQAGDDIHTD